MGGGFPEEGRKRVNTGSKWNSSGLKNRKKVKEIETRGRGQRFSLTTDARDVKKTGYDSGDSHHGLWGRVGGCR